MGDNTLDIDVARDRADNRISDVCNGSTDRDGFGNRDVSRHLNGNGSRNFHSTANGKWLCYRNCTRYLNGQCGSGCPNECNALTGCSYDPHLAACRKSTSPEIASN